MDSKHLRQRSVTSAPLVSHLIYDSRSGEISLPPSPPLSAWNEKKGIPLPPYSPRRSKRGLSLPKPWLSLLLLASTTLLFLFFVTPKSSCVFPLVSNNVSQFLTFSIPHRSTLLSRIPFKSATCEPYSYSPTGSLLVDSSDPDRNQWTKDPNDPKCSPPAFLAQLRAESTSTDFSWLYNRTALIIGDSISREHVENFCNLMGEESEVVRASHKYSPTSSPVRGTAKGSHALEKPARLSSRGHRVVRDASLPRICYIPKYDFLVSPPYFSAPLEIEF